MDSRRAQGDGRHFPVSVRQPGTTGPSGGARVMQESLHADSSRTRLPDIPEKTILRRLPRCERDLTG